MATPNAVKRGVQLVSRADARFCLALLVVGITGVMLIAKIEVPDKWWLIVTMAMVWFFTSKQNDVK